MVISKKDLLEQTGISYGQLYRWKREGLIPESWFIKKASYTGQETFFPKEKILKRIHAIQQLKDQYSLEELASLLSPEVSNRTFSEEDLEQFEEIDVDVAATFMDAMEKDSFTFAQILVMMIVSEWRLTMGIRIEELEVMIQSLMKNLPAITSIEYRIQLISIDHIYYTVFIAEDSVAKAQGEPIFFDERIQVMKEVSLLELSNTMKVKYKAQFNFTFDEEVKEDELHD